MKPSIIVSTKDAAGMNIKDVLVSLHGFIQTTETFHGHNVHAKEGIKLYTTDKDTIHAEGIDQEVEGDWLIFATKHSAESGQKSFSVHAPGNWSKAEAGGSDRKLCTAMPDIMKEAIRKIDGIYGGEEFRIVMECTHHGPLLEKPCMFIEIGSTEDEWGRKDAGEVIAKVVNYIVMNPTHKKKSVVILGGGHYNQAATKLMLKTDYSAGHVCPKHMLPSLDEKMLKQAVEKNGDRFEMVVLDWKGLGTEKQRVVGMLEKLGIKHERYQRMAKED